MDCNAVSSLSWVPRGYAKEIPVKNSHYCMNDEDVEQYFVNHNIEHEINSQTKTNIDTKLNSLGNDDNNKKDFSFYGENFFHTVEKGLSKFGKDPNMKRDQIIDYDEDDALQIKESDSLLSTTAIEDDVATLQVYLYSIEDGSFYVHHDIIIGDYPLCSEWISLGAYNKNNIIAVGSFNGEINLWNLDFIDSIDPILMLQSETGHSDAVMSLAIHSKNSKLLASGSADETVKLWDLNEGSCISTYSNCSGKVQCLEWHHSENNILISADYSRSIQIIDIRTVNHQALLKYDKEYGDPESIVLPNADIYDNGNTLIISTENGFISGYDIRMLSENCAKSKFSILANFNSKPITSVCCTSISNMLVSCDLDGVSKVWDLSNMKECIIEKSLKGGKLFTCKSCPDEEALVAFGGESVILWNIFQEDIVSKKFNL
ncbi:PWP1 family protein with WD40 repeats [Cryptosporidium ubiquitum]|uniref:PWP1 family protein with WD40 repeats n=1 Tax=Cryptosporidium ubiquitum TaxID=857276 RepID=A0A1J4MDP2_9CRYT|nr:PWP1 family protein with WD40 repeats [Cryptosporidium ubiquitum]OII72103.1 PWP1 family protein with WD40 repeats [Cryptosporidium ubiquitum]